jgi:hypothetical protein
MKRGDQEGLHEKDGMRIMDLPTEHLRLFTPAHATLWKNAVHGVWCPHPLCAAYTNNDKQA